MNNTQQKNVYYRNQVKNVLPYGKPYDVKLGGQHVHSIGLNNSFKQLLDNDFYLEQRIKSASSYAFGPKRYSERTVETAPNGYKAWGEQTTDDLVILRKENKELQETLKLAFSGKTNCLARAWETVFAGTDTGVFYSRAGGAFQEIQIPLEYVDQPEPDDDEDEDEDGESEDSYPESASDNDGVSFNGMSVYGEFLFAAASNGVYIVARRRETDPDFAETPFDLIKIDKNSIRRCNSVHFDERQNILYVGTDVGVMAGKFNPYEPVWMHERATQFESCPINMHGMRGVEIPVHAFGRFSGDPTFNSYNDLFAASDAGVLSSRQKDNVLTGQAHYLNGKKIYFTDEIDGYEFAGTDKGVFRFDGRTMFGFGERFYCACHVGRQYYFGSDGKVYSVYFKPENSEEDGVYQVETMPFGSSAVMQIFAVETENDVILFARTDDGTVYSHSVGCGSTVKSADGVDVMSLNGVNNAYMASGGWLSAGRMSGAYRSTGQISGVSPALSGEGPFIGCGGDGQTGYAVCGNGKYVAKYMDGARRQDISARSSQAFFSVFKKMSTPTDSGYDYVGLQYDGSVSAYLTLHTFTGLCSEYAFERSSGFETAVDIADAAGWIVAATTNGLVYTEKQQLDQTDAPPEFRRTRMNLTDKASLGVDGSRIYVDDMGVVSPLEAVTDFKRAKLNFTEIEPIPIMPGPDTLYSAADLSAFYAVSAGEAYRYTVSGYTSAEVSGQPTLTDLKFSFDGKIETEVNSIAEGGTFGYIDGSVSSRTYICTRHGLVQFGPDGQKTTTFGGNDVRGYWKCFFVETSDAEYEPPPEEQEPPPDYISSAQFADVVATAAGLSVYAVKNEYTTTSVTYDDVLTAVPDASAGLSAAFMPDERISQIDAQYPYIIALSENGNLYRFEVKPEYFDGEIHTFADCVPLASGVSRLTQSGELMVGNDVYEYYFDADGVFRLDYQKTLNAGEKVKSYFFGGDFDFSVLSTNGLQLSDDEYDEAILQRNMLLKFASRLYDSQPIVSSMNYFTGSTGMVMYEDPTPVLRAGAPILSGALVLRTDGERSAVLTGEEDARRIKTLDGQTIYGPAPGISDFWMRGGKIYFSDSEGVKLASGADRSELIAPLSSLGGEAAAPVDAGNGTVLLIGRESAWAADYAHEYAPSFVPASVADFGSRVKSITAGASVAEVVAGEQYNVRLFEYDRFTGRKTGPAEFVVDGRPRASFESINAIDGQFGRFLVSYDGMLYTVEDGVSAVEYDAGTGVMIPTCASRRGNEYEIGFDDGVRVSTGRGKAVVFEPVASSPASKCLEALEKYDGQHFIGAEDGLYIMKNDNGRVITYKCSQALSGTVRGLSRYCFNGADQYYTLGMDGVLYESADGKRFYRMLELSSDVAAVLPLRENEYCFATADGIKRTAYEYRLVNDTYSYTESDLKDIYDAQKPFLDAEIDDVIVAHEISAHAQDSFITRIDDELVRTDFGGAVLSAWQTVSFDQTSSEVEIDNDIVHSMEFGDRNSGEIAVELSNFLVEDPNAEFSYILRRWRSGMNELFIYIPTTNTYYINHVAGAANCAFDELTRTQRKNLVQFGAEKSMIDGSISDHVTKFRVKIADTMCELDDVIQVQVNGNSLPLKIYRDTQYANSENDAAWMYHSMVMPSEVVSYPLGKQQKDEDLNYVFDFVCFGQDAQAVKITYYDQASAAGFATFTINFNPSGANGEMPRQIMKIDPGDQPRKLRKCNFQWSKQYSKTFAGWSFRPGVQDLDLTDGQPFDWRDYADKTGEVKPGDVIQLYAVWFNYDFDKDGANEFIMEIPENG